MLLNISPEIINYVLNVIAIAIALVSFLCTQHNRNKQMLFQREVQEEQKRYRDEQLREERRREEEQKQIFFVEKNAKTWCTKINCFIW